jgi:diguanylate cyclase (GGDEF)-like protein
MAQAIAARPKVTVDPVTGSAAADDTMRLAVILALADTMAILLLADGSVRARAFDRVTLSAAAHAGMTVAQVERMIDKAADELDELAGGCGLSSITPDDLGETIDAARVRLAEMSLGTVSALAEEKVRNDNLQLTNARLATAAATDTLTGLPNRRTFNAYLAHQRASWAVRPETSALGMLLVDLDRFKQLNDRYGHPVGDEVLYQLGSRLLSGCRRGELATRIGGDEFALILPDVQPEELAGAARRLRNLIVEQPFETSVGPLEVAASLGGAHVGPAQWSCGEEETDELRHVLLRAADRALYAAKERPDGLMVVPAV